MGCLTAACESWADNSVDAARNAAGLVSGVTQCSREVVLYEEHYRIVCGFGSGTGCTDAEVEAALDGAQHSHAMEPCVEQACATLAGRRSAAPSDKGEVDVQDALPDLQDSLLCAARSIVGDDAGNAQSNARAAAVLRVAAAVEPQAWRPWYELSQALNASIGSAWAEAEAAKAEADAAWQHGDADRGRVKADADEFLCALDRMRATEAKELVARAQILAPKGQAELVPHSVCSCRKHRACSVADTLRRRRRGSRPVSPARRCETRTSMPRIQCVVTSLKCLWRGGASVLQLCCLHRMGSRCWESSTATR